MNREIETQYDAVLNCSPLTDLRKLENEFLTTRCLLINYHNICFNLKQALNEIKELINDTNKKEGLSQYVDTGKKLNDILQIIDKVGGNDDIK